MLHLHRADRADVLADALAGLLARPLSDPFALELVAVPTRGMERWLSQRLAAVLGASPGRRDGICAGVEFLPPRRLLGDALAAASGTEADTDPWHPERSVWPLLDTVQELAGEPWLASLARNVGLDADADADAQLRRGRRLSVIRHLAELFHRYGRYRPELIGAWAAGRDEDGAGGPLAGRLRWQAELWRSLRARIGTPSPAERLAPAAARIAAQPELIELPERLAGFGLTRMATADLVLLRALAHTREVHLFLLHPSPALWDALAGAPVPTRRRLDATTAEIHHPLLRSWGRDARELQLMLGEAVSHLHPRAHAGHTVLQHLQYAIVTNTAPPGEPLPGEHDDGRQLLDPADCSVQMHACHGRARQVEVLRDALLALLEADPTLEPRDVIVMCPDIEAFAPLIQATFGAGSDEDGERADLRVRLADRSLRQTNPVLAAMAALLELAASRLTASQVLDFAGREPVRRRFGLRDDDLTQLQRWVRDTGTRWGLDSAGRAPYKLTLREGTWRAGLDRVLLGVTMSESGSRRYAGVLPLDGVEDIDLAGRLAEFLARLHRAVDDFGRTQPMTAWVEALAAAAAALTSTAPGEAWQGAELRHLLDGLLAEAGRDGPSLAPAEVRALLRDRLGGRPTRANFRTGHLTVCTMYPMRSVPHRVVCLLGLDDGAFPRRAPADGDDVLLTDPLIGERDPRSEDRQLLLDALLAAEDHLLVTFTGNDERTNLSRPPAVPVGELLDAVDATVRTADGRPARAAIVLRHPLQPFDPRNFTRGSLAAGRPWSFDRTAYAGARAMQGDRPPPPRFLPAPLAPPASDILALDDLIAFVSHPARAFLAQRLGVRLGAPGDELLDALPVELDHLERWGVGQRLLDALLAGVDGQEAYRAEIARGLLPPGHLALPVIDAQLPIAAAIARTATEAASGPANPLEVLVRLPRGRFITGSAGSARGDRLLQATFSRVEARQRLTAWVRLLAATATHPERPLDAITVGRAGASRLRIARLRPLGDSTAERRRRAVGELDTLLALYDRGMCEPLPLPCRTAAAYAGAVLRGEDPVRAARERWESDWRSAGWLDGEDVDPEHLFIGPRRTLAQLMEEAPTLHEQGDGWAADEPSRFGRLARRLWDGLLAHETVT